MAYHYAKSYYSSYIADSVKATIKAFYEQSIDDGHKHHHILIRRTKAYEPAGRYQSEEEARLVDSSVKQILEELQFDYTEINAEKDINQKLLDIIG